MCYVFTNFGFASRTTLVFASRVTPSRSLGVRTMNWRAPSWNLDSLCKASLVFIRVGIHEHINFVEEYEGGLAGVELDGVGAVTEAVVAVDVVVFGAPL